MPRSKIFFLLMLFTPTILGVPTRMETADDVESELLKPANDIDSQSVDDTDLVNGVSKI